MKLLKGISILALIWITATAFAPAQEGDLEKDSRSLANKMCECFKVKDTGSAEQHNQCNEELQQQMNAFNDAYGTMQDDEAGQKEIEGYVIDELRNCDSEMARVLLEVHDAGKK